MRAGELAKLFLQVPSKTQIWFEGGVSEIRIFADDFSSDEVEGTLLAILKHAHPTQWICEDLISRPKNWRAKKLKERKG